MNWLAACRCGCGIPAPLSNLMRAIEAPVSSLRHSIFSWMPLSDFSRQANLSDWIKISSRLGAPSGRSIVVTSWCSAVRTHDVIEPRASRLPRHRFQFDKAREVGDAGFVCEPVNRPHLVDEDKRAHGLMRRNRLTENRLDFVLPTAE